MTSGSKNVDTNKMKIKNCCFLFFLGLLISCNDNNLKDIQKMNSNTFFAAGVAENINAKYTDSARIKAILVSKKMLDYSQVKYPFTHFPERIHVTVFDINKNKTIVVANKATTYNKTNIIDLQGNVKITTHDGKILETQQLYYNQKDNWFFTDAYFKFTDPSKSYFEGIGIDFDTQLKIMNAQQNRAEINNIKQ